MTIFLKLWLPKAVLASITISKGGRVRSQWMDRELQQSKLKGHSKKRCNVQTSFFLYHGYKEHSYNLLIFPSQQVPCIKSIYE